MGGWGEGDKKGSYFSVRSGLYEQLNREILRKSSEVSSYEYESGLNLRLYSAGENARLFIPYEDLVNDDEPRISQYQGVNPDCDLYFGTRLLEKYGYRYAYEQKGSEHKVRYGLRLVSDKPKHHEEENSIFWKLLLLALLAAGGFLGYKYYKNYLLQTPVDEYQRVRIMEDEELQKKEPRAEEPAKKEESKNVELKEMKDEPTGQVKQAPQK